MKELLEELFSRYYKDVYAYLYSLCRDASLAEDLTSEVFLEVVKSIGSFRGESDIKTWLFSIARHRWYAHLRSRARQVPTESIHELMEINAAYAPSPSDSEGVEQMIAAVLDGESELTKHVFRMRLEGYSYYEIAARYRVSESSARVVYFRAKSKLKKHLEKEGVV